MASTTVVSDDSVTTVISEPDVVAAVPFTHRISWSAIFSGALVAAAVTFFLLALGSGFGLSLVTARHATEDSAATFLTLGAVYFFAAQAFGFAAGGHVTGRLMGPVLENPKEEEFLGGAHGAVTWALAVVTTATMVYLGALAAGTVVAGGAAVGAAAPNTAMSPAENGYWVDRLFRPAPQAAHASLGWHDYAQVDDGTATDASPVEETPPAAAPLPSPGPAPAARADVLAPTTSPSHAVELSPTSGISAMPTPVPVVETTVPPSPSLASDKSEAGRILTVAMANGGSLSEVDRAQLAHLVAQDTGQTQDGAMRRVENVEKQIHESEVKAAETARKIAAYASLWTALALLFGSVVTVMASISARWEDDRVTFEWPSRR